MEFTSAETLGVEGVVVEAFVYFAGLAIDEGRIELTTPSIGIFVSGLVGSMLGRGGNSTAHSHILGDMRQQ